MINSPNFKDQDTFQMVENKMVQQIQDIHTMFTYRYGKGMFKTIMLRFFNI